MLYKTQTKSFRGIAIFIQLFLLALPFYSGCESDNSESSIMGTATIRGNIVNFDTAKRKYLPVQTFLTQLKNFLTVRASFAQVRNVIVTVKDTDILGITDNVGNFELEGVHPGIVTLIFSSDSNEIGSLIFNGVPPDSLITLLNIRIKAEGVQADDINIQENLRINSLLVKSGGNPEIGIAQDQHPIQ